MFQQVDGTNTTSKFVVSLAISLNTSRHHYRCWYPYPNTVTVATVLSVNFSCRNIYYLQSDAEENGRI